MPSSIVDDILQAYHSRQRAGREPVRLRLRLNRIGADRLAMEATPELTGGDIRVAIATGKIVSFYGMPVEIDPELTDDFELQEIR